LEPGPHGRIEQTHCSDSRCTFPNLEATMPNAAGTDKVSVPIDASIEVSVVVPTWGRLDQLDTCLDALARQTLSPSRFEIIVVDDEPDHNTLHLVSSWRMRRLEQGPRLTYLANPGPHCAAAARNRGWHVARADIIAFTDDAAIPDPDWLAQGLSVLAADVDAVCGKICMPLAATPTEYQRQALRKRSAEFACANFFCRRSVLEAEGGFDERFADADCSENDLHFRLLKRPARMVHADRVVVTQPLRTPPWGASVSELRHSVGQALLFKKHPRLYREKIQGRPPWDYYAIVGVLGVAIAATVTSSPAIAAAGVLAWLWLTGALCRRRLEGTSHSVQHVAEILVTSILIPPLAVFWRLAGALRYRVRFA
jgi:glycosyltransferase involved in cell wall biosynthesis